MDCDIRSGLSESDGDGGAQSTRGTGDQRCFALQIEFFEYQRNLSFRVGQRSEILSALFGLGSEIWAMAAAQIASAGNFKDTVLGMTRPIRTFNFAVLRVRQRACFQDRNRAPGP